MLFLASKGLTQFFDQFSLVSYGRFKAYNTIYTFALYSIHSSHAILLLSFRRIFALLLRSWYVFTFVLPFCFAFQERYVLKWYDIENKQAIKREWMDSNGIKWSQFHSFGGWTCFPFERFSRVKWCKFQQVSTCLLLNSFISFLFIYYLFGSVIFDAFCVFLEQFLRYYFLYYWRK